MTAKEEEKKKERKREGKKKNERGKIGESGRHDLELLIVDCVCFIL
jgi:hypothetical protein